MFSLPFYFGEETANAEMELFCTVCAVKIWFVLRLNVKRKNQIIFNYGKSRRKTKGTA